MPTASENRAAAASAHLLIMSEQLASRTERVSIGELLDGLGRASLGLGLMVPSLLAMIPLPGPFGVLFGTIIGAIAVQVMMGETRLRLPRFLAVRTIPPAAVGTALRRFATPLQWAERLSTPRRLLPLTGRVARVVLAAPLLIMAMTITLPIPLERDDLELNRKGIPKGRAI